MQELKKILDKIGDMNMQKCYSLNVNYFFRNTCILSARKNRSVHFVKLCLNFPVVNHGRIRSVCIVLDCEVGGCGFDSGTGPILKVLILLIKLMYM